MRKVSGRKCLEKSFRGRFQERSIRREVLRRRFEELISNAVDIGAE